MGPSAAAALRLPDAPSAIRKGEPVKLVLGDRAVRCLSHNIASVHPPFERSAFERMALDGLEPLGILDRGQHIAAALRHHLPARYEAAIDVMLASLTPPLTGTEGLGLAVFFYLPHVCFVARYGREAAHNGGDDPFEASMAAQHALTQRFSAEFSIRPFLIHDSERTLTRLFEWTADPSAHVRRLCSEGTRPRLPWAPRIAAFVADPTPVLPILERLKDDPDLYVRRSVANHVGDIAKDHPGLALGLCKRWLIGASEQRKWVVRHALRHPAKKGDRAALRLRLAAKAAT